MRWSTLFAAAFLSAGITLALVARGFAPDAAALLDAHGFLARFARSLTPTLGDAGALRAALALGSALSGASLAAALSTGRDRSLGGVAWAVAGLAALSAPITTGVLHGIPGAVCLGPAALALVTWPAAPLRAAVITGIVGVIDPATGAALAVAGFVLSPGALPFVLAPLLASLGEPGAADTLGLPAVAAVQHEALVPATAGALLPLGLLLSGGPWRLRLAGLAAAALAVGPVTTVILYGRLLPVPLPALPLAACGAEAGWSGAGVVAAAALVLAVREAAGARALGVAALVAIEGMVCVARLPAAMPASAPEAVRSLAERSGTVLHLPVTRAIHGEPTRAALWRHEAILHGRPIYRDGRGVNEGDPVLGEPGVVAVLGLLEPEEGWLIPQTEPTTTLRAMGITELVLDRQALTKADLAKLDPVLARLYGVPQRDVAGRIDLWRIDPGGKARLADSPYLRKAGMPGADSWRTLEELLAAGRGPQ